MEIKELKEKLNEQINKAKKVETTLVSDGWKIFEELLEKNKAELKNIYKISTLKELEANKKALRIIEKTISEFKDLVNTGLRAREELDKLDTTS